MINAVKISVTGQAEKITFDETTLEAYQKVVSLRHLPEFSDSSEYIECLSLGDLGDMWLNEEGKIYNFPENHLATYIVEEVFPGFSKRDYISGPVLITGSVDGSGEPTSLSDEDIASILIIAKLHQNLF